MRLKTSIKYYIKDMLGSIMVFYLVIALIIISMIIINGSTGFFINASINGLEVVTIIFLFVCGLNTFKPQFKFLSQNSVSRKNVVTAFMFSSVICIAMALIDILVAILLNAILPEVYQSFFYSMYYNIFKNTSFVFYITQFVYLSVFYMLAFMFGHFISSLYYRMNTIAKIIVSVGAFIVFNACGILLRITAFANFYYKILALCGYDPLALNPWKSSLAGIILFFAFGFLSYLCIRRVKVRE